MENEIDLPFKVGELAEARSFQIGYRGAWFRCKIREITKKKGFIGHVSEYYDFPDEKMKWTKLYQVPCLYVGKGKEKHRELVLRPAYPPIYSEKQIPSVISEVIVIRNDSWKVGDLVDWWTTGCYWSGRIRQLLGDDKAEIVLKPPPFGEGASYDILLKDLRPSLDWSPEYGWTVPTQEGDTGHSPCARLIKPISKAIVPPSINSAETKAPKAQENEAREVTAGSLVRPPFLSPVSSNSAFSDEAKSTGPTEMQKQSSIVSIELKENETGKTSLADSDSGQALAEPVAEIAEEDLNSGCFPSKPRNKGVALRSMQSDSLEAVIMDLEEYVNKVKWLKGMLHRGISSSSDSQRSRWEFVDPHAASEIPK